MTQGFVADCSVGVAWVVAAQSTSAAAELRERIASGEPFYVPALWPLEVSNALLVLCRRGRISSEERAAACSLLVRYRPVLDGEGPRLAFSRLLDLSDEHGLGIYDATYLELAIRRKAPLASRDSALNKAARRCGIETLL